MFFSKSSAALAVAALLPFVAAESTSSTTMLDSTTTSTTSTPSGSVLVHVINAKTLNGKPVFDPPQVIANPGELVQFQFWPMNHSVVQATFKDPCLPIAQSSAGNGTQGFFSGFMPVSTNSTSMPTFTIEVNDTKPIWFYCSQAKHCQNGMVGVINPTTAKNLTDFASRAALATSNVTPGVNATASTNSSSTSGTSVSSGSSTMSTTTTGTDTSTSTATAAPAGTNAAPGSAVYVSSAMAMVMAALAASMLLA